MKRYWLFAGNDFYADGGFCDFHGSFDTLEGSKDRLTQVDESLHGSGWYHIFDSQSQTIVDFEEGSYSGNLQDMKQRDPEDRTGNYLTMKEDDPGKE